MFKSYLKIALRNLQSHKGHSFINIIGLAIGMACCILILLWVQDELSSDRFHEKTKHLYRVEQDYNYSGELYHVNVTPHPMAPALKEEIPEIVDATRYVWTDGVLLRYGEKTFFEDGVRVVDPSFLQMFTFQLIKGDKNIALKEPFSLVISEEMAEKYFGDEEPIGKTILVNNQYDFTVTGVMKNMPDNSYLKFDLLMPYDYLLKTGRTNPSWSGNSILTFVQLHEHAAISEVNEKISVVHHKHSAATIQDAEELKRFSESPRVECSVMSYTQIRLHAYFGYGRPMGDIQYVYIFSIIAIFVLLIACINFMNLATARSANRAQEIGMRKVVGASRHSIIRQFLGESILLTLIALVFAIMIVSLLLPTFNKISGKALSSNVLGNWQILVGMFVISLVTGIIAGSYPAIFLSAFKPAKVLKGALKSGTKSSALRRMLVVVQFSLSIFLIIGTGIVYNQVQFMRSKKLGYDKEHLLYIPMRGEISNYYAALKNKLKNNSRILGVTASFDNPSNLGSNSSGADWDGKDPQQELTIGFNFVDFDFIETMKIELAEGRSFSREFATDTTEAFLVNEQVVKLMGEESAVGKRFTFMGRQGKIVGVMKNFHYQSIREIIEPMAMMIAPRNTSVILIRISPQDIAGAMDFIEATWKKVIPNYPFEYTFLDEDFDDMYHAEQRMEALLKYFSIFAIFIACLGLFGLASFTAEQRRKELGIRKVLGASVPEIMMLLSKEFTRWVLVANLIAWPMAYIIMNRWLQSFAYRTNVEIGTYFLAMTIAFAVAMMTVSYHSIKAALANPVESLRYE